MLAYAHPEFAAEFGCLVKRVLADAARRLQMQGPPGPIDAARRLQQGPPGPGLPIDVAPADPSKAGPGTTVVYVAFCCTGRLDDPVHARALQPYLQAGARVVLLLARAGQAAAPPLARITPLKDLAGLPTLEFLVHKRALQTGGSDYPREIDALAALLREALPAFSPPASPPLPPLDEFLFGDVVHMVP